MIGIVIDEAGDIRNNTVRSGLLIVTVTNLGPGTVGNVTYLVATTI